VRATGTAPAAVLGTINVTVEGAFNVEPASQMSDISADPQDAVEFSVAAIPSVGLQGSGPGIPEAGAIIKLLQASSGSTVGPVMASARNAPVNSALPAAIGPALGQIGDPATFPHRSQPRRNA
jgi:hypothetical protein